MNSLSHLLTLSLALARAHALSANMRSALDCANVRDQCVCVCVSVCVCVHVCVVPILVTAVCM
jgi:hypothetical protein